MLFVNWLAFLCVFLQLSSDGLRVMNDGSLDLSVDSDNSISVPSPTAAKVARASSPQG